VTPITHNDPKLTNTNTDSLATLPPKRRTTILADTSNPLDANEPIAATDILLFSFAITVVSFFVTASFPQLHNTDPAPVLIV
jgi:hypothetical protein